MKSYDGVKGRCVTCGSQCHDIMHGITVLYKAIAKLPLTLKITGAVTFVYYQAKSHLLL